MSRVLYRQPTGAGRGGPGLPKSAEVVAGRVEDFAEVLAQGYSRLHAAERLGVSYRTACRYITRLRQQASGSGRSLGQLRPGNPAVPGDELADDLRSIANADEEAELIPQIIADPNGPVRRVGRGLHPHIVTRGYPHREPFS